MNKIQEKKKKKLELKLALASLKIVEASYLFSSTILIVLKGGQSPNITQSFA